MARKRTAALTVLGIVLAAFSAMHGAQRAFESPRKKQSVYFVHGDHPTYQSLADVRMQADVVVTGLVGASSVEPGGAPGDDEAGNPLPVIPHTLVPVRVKSVQKGDAGLVGSNITISILGGATIQGKYVLDAGPVTQPNSVVMLFLRNGSDDRYYPLAGSAVAIKQKDGSFLLPAEVVGADQPILFKTADVGGAVASPPSGRTGGGAPVPSTNDSPVQGPPTRAAGVTRFAGEDRYATAAAVSRGSFPGTANDVFIVTGEGWPDALAAGAAAAAVAAPVLPVTAGKVPAAIRAELARLQPLRAWVIGGQRVVDDAVLDALKAQNIAVTRIAGPDRYATAAAIQHQFFVSAAGAYYASGANYADSLGGGAAAAKRGWPLLLTAPDYLPASTPIVGSTRIVIGGPAAVGDAVLGQLNARRVAGANRYETAVAIALDAFSTASVAYLVTGQNYPDALAGTPAADRDRGPILLASGSCVTQATKDTINKLGAASRVVLGGTDVVSNAAANLVVCGPPS